MSAGGKDDLPRVGDGPWDEDSADETKLSDILRLGARPVNRPWLLVVQGVRSLGKLARIQGEMVIGRSSEADFPLDEEGVSRRHAKIQLVAGGVVRIADLDSSNGVRVNGVKIKTHALRDGERIRLGDAVLTLVHMDDDPSTLAKNLGESLRR